MCVSLDQVLFQGCQLDETKREAFLHQVYTQLCAFENKVAEMLQQQYEPKPQVRRSQVDGVSQLNKDLHCGALWVEWQIEEHCCKSEDGIAKEFVRELCGV